MKSSLHSLPPELKQQIVYCCAEQDDSLACAFGTLVGNVVPTEVQPATSYDPLRRTINQNRSLVALAAVSREWNDLVAPVLFEGSPINKIRSLHFATRVLPRRGHHFVRLCGDLPPSTAKRNDPPEMMTGPSSIRFDDLIRTLPHLPNLTELHTPDLIGDLRAGLRRSLDEAEQLNLGPEAVSVYRCLYREREEAILSLLERVESIVYPIAVPRDLLNSFEHISGVNLKTLVVNVMADDPQSTVDFAALLDKFLNLESLTVHVEMFDAHGALNSILVAAADAPATPPHPPPNFRNLVLTGTFHRAQFPHSDPSSAAVLRFAHRFAATLRTLDLDLGCADHDPDGERSSNTDLDDYVDDLTPLAFTDRFPYLHRLVLRDLAASASATALLASIDATTLPALVSCVCYPPDTPDGEEEDMSSSSRLHLAKAAASSHSIPGFKVLGEEASPAIESMSARLFKWHHRHRVDHIPDHHLLLSSAAAAESTYPEPLRYPSEEGDPVELSERVQLMLEHLNEWYRSAREAQDVDTLAQMRDMLEDIDARMRAGLSSTRGRPEARAAVEAPTSSKLEAA